MNKLERTGILFGLLAMLCYSLMDGIWKHCLMQTTMPVVFFVTYAVAIVILLGYARAKKAPILPKSGARSIIYATFNVCELITFALALRTLPIAPLFVILLTTPLCVLIGARFLLQEKLSRMQTFSVCSGFAGAFVVIMGRTATAHAAVAATGFVHFALLFAIANVGINSSKILYLRRFCGDENSFGLNLSAAMAFTLGYGALAGPQLLHLPLPVVVWLLLAGGLSAAAGMAYIRASQTARAPLMAATQYSQILWATLMGTLVFHEALPPTACIGAGLIVLSGILLYSHPRMPTKPANPEALIS